MKTMLRLALADGDRPKNSILENRRLKDAGVYCMVDWRDDVAAFAARYRDRLISEAMGGNA